MNKLASVPKLSRDGISAAEWQARVDLAAVYRLTAHYGWDDVIYNHSSMRVPDEPRKLLMKKHDLLYTEVTASNLVKVSMDEDLDEKSGVNRPGFTLHGGVLSARPDVNCAMHVHTNVGMAIAGLKSGLRMVSQQAIRFYKRIGYHAYEGITEDFDERERLNRDLGQNRAMIMHNHGLLTVGKSAREAFVLMKKHDLLYTEVTASNLVKVSMDEDLDEKSGVNRPGFTLHGGVLSARPDVNCAMHVHTNVGMAIAGLKSGLRMVSQQAIRFYKRIGYHAYEGITEDFDERERLNRDLGQNRAMIMHNHGLLTVGKSAREAFVLMKHLIDAADIQLRLEATSAEVIEIPPEVCAKTAEQYEHHDAGRGSHDWAAYLRRLDQIDTSYRN